MAPSPARLRVATWNIRAAIGPGEPFPPSWWLHVDVGRLARIGRQIDTLDAEVVALQEVTIMTVDGALLDQPSELARLTGRHVRYSAAHAFPLIRPEDGVTIGVATWGNALLTRAPVSDGFGRGLPIGLDDEPVEPVDSGLPLAGVTYAQAPYGTREPRSVVGGRLPRAHGAVAVLGTHLTYAGVSQRSAQARALARMADDAGDPVIVMGDLNAAIGAPELEPLTARLDDAFAAVGIPEGSSARASSGPLPIDHILTRGFRVVACRVVVEAGDASDHLPVLSTLERTAT